MASSAATCLRVLDPWALLPTMLPLCKKRWVEPRIWELIDSWLFVFIVVFLEEPLRFKRCVGIRLLLKLLATLL